MALDINWWKDGYCIDQQTHQLDFAIIDADQAVLLTALSDISIYGNFLLSLWIDLLQNFSEDVHSLYLSNLQLGSGKSIRYCRRNSRISGY